MSNNDNELMEVEEIAVSDGGAARFAAVDVKSGEEKYDILFEESGKLLRFDEGENQWKERGQGTCKVMRHKEDAGKFMFIFRRTEIGKLAAQHYLIKGMKVKLHPQNDKFLIWTAFKDYTDDEEGFPENFVLRFTSKEVAERALKQMESAIANSKA